VNELNRVRWHKTNDICRGQSLQAAGDVAEEFSFEIPKILFYFKRINDLSSVVGDIW
jgi:hypothetical protein